MILVLQGLLDREDHPGNGVTREIWDPWVSLVKTDHPAFLEIPAYLALKVPSSDRIWSVEMMQLQLNVMSFSRWKR